MVNFLTQQDKGWWGKFSKIHLCRGVYLSKHNDISWTLLAEESNMYIRSLIPLLLRTRWRKELVHQLPWYWPISFQWRHNNELDGVSNHRRIDCLFNLMFSCRSKKTSKLRITGPCEGNPPMTGGFPSQRANNAENVSIWWRHHVYGIFRSQHQPGLFVFFPLTCARKCVFTYR